MGANLKEKRNEFVFQRKREEKTEETKRTSQVRGGVSGHELDVVPHPGGVGGQHTEGLQQPQKLHRGRVLHCEVDQVVEQGLLTEKIDAQISISPRHREKYRDP